MGLLNIIHRMHKRQNLSIREISLSMGGQIIDATLVAAPRQHNSEDEKAAIKEVSMAVQFPAVEAA